MREREDRQIPSCWRYWTGSRGEGAVGVGLRDTVTDVKIYDESGEYLATEHAQIALQYAYGTSAKRSIQMTKEAVANLLYEVPLALCVFECRGNCADRRMQWEGLPLTIPADYTMIDPAFTQGSVFTLNGAQAEAYVRYRDQAVTGSNTQRMERQNEFLLALFQTAESCRVKEPGRVSSGFLTAREIIWRRI